MGPLSGVRIVEMSGIGPGPYCGMLLADLGAEIIRVDRLSVSELGFALDPKLDLLNRSKRAVAVDLKAPAGVALVKRLIAGADILIEGFRPGVMERLGLGPDVALGVNPRLVYGRMTGFGQDGPMKDQAGHDINYIAVSGALHAIGPAEAPPPPPLNLVGDFGGGALFLAMGVLAALIETRGSGKGQVVDAAMIDGVSSLMTMLHGFRAANFWTTRRGANVLDGAAPYYATYAASDGRYLAVGAIEPKFYRELISKLGLSDADLPGQNDRSRWGELRGKIAAAFATRTRDEWADIFSTGDACVSPVLDMAECQSHPLAEERGMFVTVAGVPQPGPAPRFSRTPGAVRSPPEIAARDTAGALAAWGLSAAEIAALAQAGIIPPAAASGTLDSGR